MARQVEAQSKAAFESRLAVHRETGACELGLDRLGHLANLNADERTILVCVLVVALGDDLAEEVYEGLDIYLGVDVEAVLRLLEASTVADRLRVRRMLQAEGPLVRHGLVRLTGKDDTFPQDVNNMTVKLTQKAFDLLVA